MRIIDKALEKIKSFFKSSYFDEILMVLVVLCISFGSFALGAEHERKRIEREHPIRIYDQQDVAEIWQAYHTSKKEDSYFYASQNGKTYYPRDCSAGSRIKDENRVYFSTQQEAESLGYSLSKRCV